MIDAIAVRQIASTSKAGAADAGDMLADSIVNMINQETTDIGESTFFHLELYKLCETEAPDIERYVLPVEAICRTVPGDLDFIYFHL